MRIRIDFGGTLIVASKHQRLIFVATFFIFFFAPVHPVICQTTCSPSVLSRHEAQGLLRVIPEALAASKVGGKLSVVDWSPGPHYRLDEFYFYELLSTKSPPTTPLGNGVIGYFGVNKFTGQVVELNSPDPAVQGTNLERMQTRLRAQHCIGRDFVRKYQDIPLEK